jgi:hypothetical protein
LYGCGTWFYSEGKKVVKIETVFIGKCLGPEDKFTYYNYLLSLHCGNQINEIKMARHAMHMEGTRSAYNDIFRLH